MKTTKRMNTPPTILVIEDDPDGRRSVCEALEDAGWRAVGAADGQSGLRLFEAQGADVVVSDIRLPDLDGLEVLARLRQRDAALPVLLMTAYGTVASAVAALKAGAYDYLLKPLDLADIQAKVARALETRRLRAQVHVLRDALRARHDLIAESAAMRAVLQQLKAVAPTQATVLVYGESGSGKELIARRLHEESPRADGPFVAVNCGAFSESLLESELFGHEKGAFTGAAQRHPGAFERAHGGTLLLDEIGIAPPAVQTRLLRVLEEREFTRVGGREPVRVDVRFVSATNRPLDDLVAEKTFRHDLLYRLQVVTLHLPPLRDRREDIRPLADRFIAQACADHGRHIAAVEPDFYRALEAHPWPGNVRELKHAVESAVIMAGAPTLAAADLRLGAGAIGPRVTAVPENLTLVALEKQALHQALHRHKGSRGPAAADLGISTRTIQRKIREYNLPF